MQHTDGYMYMHNIHACIAYTCTTKMGINTLAPIMIKTHPTLKAPSLNIQNTTHLG